jgi:hypothetical protein
MKNVFQDVWSPYVFNRVRDLITGGNMPWFVCITDYYGQEVNPYNHKWQHIAYHKDLSQTHVAPYLEMAAGDAISRSGQNIDEIIRIRCSVTGITPENHVADPHVDTDFPHRTALFYLNDCDGDTIMYKEKYDPSKRLDQTQYFKQHVGTATLDYTITPQANQMAWFDGLTYHSSNSPTNSAKRYIINVNYTVRD